MCLVGFDRAEVILIVRHCLRKLTASAFEKMGLLENDVTNHQEVEI